ncbi:hypothetical protein EW145_g7805, partial [Phellinidium pouzarii]
VERPCLSMDSLSLWKGSGGCVNGPYTTRPLRAPLFSLIRNPTRDPGTILSGIQSSDSISGLSSFYDNWIDLRDDVKEGVEKQTLTYDLAELAFSAASRVELLAQSFLELQISIDDITADLLPEAEAILNQELSFQPQISSLSGDYQKFTPSRLDDLETGNNYCYSWFLDHLHNPYPSLAVKERLSNTTGVSLKTIVNCFVQLRRKVGWTAISKKHFRGDRSLTVDCAHRIFIERTGYSSYSEKIIQDFEDMKETAERLCRDRTQQSSLVKKLETITSPTAQSTVSRKQKRRRSSSSERETIASSSAATDSGSSRKRPRHTTEERDTESDSLRPLKRGRSVSLLSTSSLTSTPSFRSSSIVSTAPSSSGPLTPLSSPTTLPAEIYSELPAHILDNWIEGVSAEAAMLQPNVAEQMPSVLSQKRSLPDSESHRSAKRARHGPQPQPQPQPCSSHRSHTASPAPPAPAPAPAPAPPQPAAASLECDAPALTGMPQLAEILPPRDGERDVFGLGASADVGLDDSIYEILSQLNTDVPPAATPWGGKLVTGLGAGPVGDGHGSSVAAPLSMYDFLSLPETDNSEAYPDDVLSILSTFPPSEGGTAKNDNVHTRHTAEDALSLTCADLAFLEGLGGEDGDGGMQRAELSGGGDTPIALVDAPSDTERRKKLERLNEILAEAERLKQEVYNLSSFDRTIPNVEDKGAELRFRTRIKVAFDALFIFMRCISVLFWPSTVVLLSSTMVFKSTLDSHVYDQLTQIEDDLLDISIADRITLEDFVARLAKATDETTQGLKSGALSSETILRARRIALSGRLIADQLIQLQRINENVASERESDISRAFARMSLNDTSTDRVLHSRTGGSKLSVYDSVVFPSITEPSDTFCCGISANEDFIPRYIGNACEWLLQHFYNPYPSHQEKLSIIGDSDVPVKTVSNWFVHARQRIGWTSIAKKFFRNTRAEVIDYAFRVFIKPDPSLPIKKEIAEQFKEMKANVEKLYKEKFEASDAAKTLEETVAQVLAKEEKKTSKDLKKGIAVKSMASKVLNKMRKRTDPSVPSESASEQDHVVSPISTISRTVTSQKRKADTSRDDEEHDLECDFGHESGLRQTKRKRVLPDSTPQADLLEQFPISDLPAPSVLVLGTADPDTPASFSKPFESVAFSANGKQCKRRLSDAERDFAPLPKRRRGSSTTSTRTDSEIYSTPSDSVLSSPEASSSIYGLPADNVFSNDGQLLDMPPDVAAAFVDSSLTNSQNLNILLSSFDHTEPPPASIDYSYLAGDFEVSDYNWKDCLGDSSLGGPTSEMISAMLPSQKVNFPSFDALSDTILASHSPFDQSIFAALSCENPEGNSSVVAPLGCVPTLGMLEGSSAVSPTEVMPTKLESRLQFDNTRSYSWDFLTAKKSFTPDGYEHQADSLSSSGSEFFESDLGDSAKASSDSSLPSAYSVLARSALSYPLTHGVSVAQEMSTEIRDYFDRMAKMERLRRLKEETSKLESDLFPISRISIF